MRSSLSVLSRNSSFSLADSISSSKDPLLAARSVDVLAGAFLTGPMNCVKMFRELNSSLSWPTDLTTSGSGSL